MAQDPFGFGGLDDIFRAMQGGVDPNNAYRQQQTPPTQPAGPNGAIVVAITTAVASLANTAST